MGVIGGRILSCVFRNGVTSQAEIAVVFVFFRGVGTFILQLNSLFHQS